MDISNYQNPTTDYDHEIVSLAKVWSIEFVCKTVKLLVSIRLDQYPIYYNGTCMLRLSKALFMVFP